MAQPVVPRRSIFYGIYMGRQFSATPFLCADSQNAHRCHDGIETLDIVYLLLAGALVTATIGFLLICDRLDRR